MYQWTLRNQEAAGSDTSQHTDQSPVFSRPQGYAAEAPNMEERKMRIATRILLGLVILAATAEVADAGFLGGLFKRSRGVVRQCVGRVTSPRKAGGNCRGGVCRKPMKEKSVVVTP